MAILRPTDTLSNPFWATTWVKQEHSIELAEQSGLWQRADISVT
jgi:hypothetical protein